MTKVLERGATHRPTLATGKDDQSPGLTHQPVDLHSKHFRFNKIIPNLLAHVVIFGLTQTVVALLLPGVWYGMVYFI